MGGLLWFIGIGLVTGCLAGVLVKGGGFGFLGDIVVGVLGGVSGGYVFDYLGITSGDLPGAVLMATVSATTAIFVLRLVGKTARSSRGYATSSDAVSAPASSPVPLIRRPSRTFGSAAVSRTDMTSHLG